jgi:hypothetical protein
MANSLSASVILGNITISDYVIDADAANAKTLLEVLKSDHTSINTAYTTAIEKITDLKTLMDLCKSFAKPLTPLNTTVNFMNYAEQTKLLIYFAKFIIKKRATYLYLYTALMHKTDELKKKMEELKNATAACTTSTQQLNAIKDKIKAVLKPLNTNSTTTIVNQIESIFDNNANSANIAQTELTKKITDINEELIFLRKFTKDSMDLAIKWNDTEVSTVPLVP